MRRFLGVPVGLFIVAAALVFSATAAMGEPGHLKHPRLLPSGPEMSGPAEFRDMEFGTTITECPQAGLAGRDDEHPLDRRKKDKAEQLSEGGDDVRANTDYSCFPQNETSIAINPITRRNVLSSQNDYRTLARQGFNASTDNGNSWYSAELPPLSVPNGDVLDASGDPVSVYDRAGVAYEAAINFNRTDDENGITVQRSTNGGYTWTRPCVPIATTNEPATDPGRCGSIGDPRQPGDGVVTYFDDPDQQLNGNVPFDDKEWMAAGPRPAGVQPVCFSPFTRTPRTCDPKVVGVDRLYVTWTRFNTTGCVNPPVVPCEGRIWLSYSDDQARSWSPPRPISGTASFCAGIGPLGPDNCDDNQFSVPTVHPRTGLLGVAFENFNTPHENQYLFVRSRDGGQTFEGPFFVTPVFDVNYPRAGAAGGRPDCTARGQQGGRQVVTNSCFRLNSGGNVTVDKRGNSMTSGFGDDFYLTMSDNRNGTRASSNTDIFLFKSTDGGMTWIGPTRVNNDRSVPPPDRDCVPYLINPGPPPTIGGPNPDCPRTANFGNDQWFPWNDVSSKGVLAVGFHDRRLDTDSVRHEWPTSRERPGNYLAWFWGAGCKIDSTATVTATTTTIPAEARDCLAPGAAVIPQPTGLQNPGANPVPGQGPAYLGPFRNNVVSDVAHNLDYSFRAGIFMGDYNAIAFPNVPGSSWGSYKHSGNDDDDDHAGSDRAVGFWTDARNGRGSGNPTNPETYQPGRNPACEQADVFVDWFNPLSSGSGHHATRGMEHFLVTPCPSGSTHHTDDD